MYIQYHDECSTFFFIQSELNVWLICWAIFLFYWTQIDDGLQNNSNNDKRLYKHDRGAILKANTIQYSLMPYIKSSVH